MVDKSSHRAPASEARRRDPERTKEALLDAARVEFADKGFAGARVSEIALRAGVNKQLISYYFDGKEGLYRALVDRWLEREQEFAPQTLPLPDLVASYVQNTVDEREMARIFVRDSLNDAYVPDHTTEDDLDNMRRRQEAGEIAGEIDPAFLFLALQGMASAGVAFPADARNLTGLDPASPEFAEAYGEQLRRIVARLAE